VRLRVERTHPDEAVDRGQALCRSPTSSESLDETPMSLEAAGLKARRLPVVHARLEPPAGSCERISAGEMGAGTVGEYT
jgi:hypothetical protein